MWESWQDAVNASSSYLVRTLRSTPLLGALLLCRGKDHFQALCEFTSTIVLGTMPLWLDALRIYIFNVSGRDLPSIVKEVITNGELYVYCASFLAPIFYIALTERKGDKPFPSKLSFLLSTTLILILSAFLFSIKRSQSTYVENTFTSISIVLFVFSALLFYLATVYRNFKSFDFSEEMYKEEEDFTDKLLASRGQK